MSLGDRLPSMQSCEGTRVVTETLEEALAVSGCDRVTVAHRTRRLSDNGSSYISDDLAVRLEEKNAGPCPRSAKSSTDPGHDRALASDREQPHTVGKRLST